MINVENMLKEREASQAKLKSTLSAIDAANKRTVAKDPDYWKGNTKLGNMTLRTNAAKSQD